ncbi:hypothetical protein NPIL_332641 [Nephila pilipes]|uniref:Uncharacterized protein n=1 Tax=Nephila pilipes TaxID=299642 RepID=A0A8X6N7X8_NEPPI|nr:hypothetical protein NPIL_332641 [Nephila pilipes]
MHIRTTTTNRLEARLLNSPPRDASQSPQGAIHDVLSGGRSAADNLEPIVKSLEGNKNKQKHPRSNARNSIEQIEWNDDANLSFKPSKDALAMLLF